MIKSRKSSRTELVKSIDKYLKGTSKNITYKNCKTETTGKGYDKNRGSIITVCNTKRNMKGLDEEWIKFQMKYNDYTRKEAEEILRENR